MDQKINRLVKNEQKVLGIILNDPTYLEETKLNTKHFYSVEHRALFKALLDLSSKGTEIDILSLEDLGHTAIISFGGPEYLRNLFAYAPDGETFKRHQNLILEYWTIETAERLAHSFLDGVREQNDMTKLTLFIDQMTKLEGNTVEDKQSFKDMLLNRAREHADTPEKGLSGVNTGYMSLNLLTDGWQDGDLIVIGARPSMGKTALVLNCALEGSKKDKIMPTIFSIEMSEGAVIDRLIATEGRINLMKMRNPNKYFEASDWNKYHNAMSVLEKLKFSIRRENTVNEMRAVVRRNMKENPDFKHVVMIDFLTLMKTIENKASRHHEIEDIILALKHMAAEFNIPVIILSQLSRGLEQRQDKRPMMSDLRESGAIEQTADLILFLYRDDYYYADSQTPGITEILFSKNRQGRTGMVNMKFVKETNTFHDITP
ncbi:replicative DNA helicase [Fictibacillus aquaticus]|uniref:DNA 5'-3' helicase n=1 Tax=Fictibacillus aquaticus TaxID=2021314 RepID=A0A235F9Q2_9BACL|nr:DnaB-like helicase C-terminal domain-containing protein [Fictibacillus aquaticus]OYD57889.1 hypothetical protein CGZ90_08285 [Fictibacillus aquaticus]